MRQDQFERLQDLAERLTDQALSDSNPDTWSAAGKTSAEMTKDERGDAYWSRKMAVSTLSVLTKVVNLVGVAQLQSAAGAGAAAVTEGESDLDREVKAAEAEANKLLDKLNRQQSKAAFDKHVHGTH